MQEPSPPRNGTSHRSGFSACTVEITYEARLHPDKPQPRHMICSVLSVKLRIAFAI